MTTGSGASRARSSCAAFTADGDRQGGRFVDTPTEGFRARNAAPSRTEPAWPARLRRAAPRRSPGEVDTRRAARRQYLPVPVPRISKEELKQRLDGSSAPVIVDARLKYPYEHSTVRLPGAVRYAGEAATPSLPRDRDIVVYDSDPNELASTRVAAELIRQGYRAVALKGGISEWLDAKLPTETKEAPRQAPPEPGALKG